MSCVAWNKGSPLEVSRGPMNLAHQNDIDRFDGD
jgi:hypothetical protein